MRTILIPTDFTVDSLMAIKKTLQINADDEIKIILFHCVILSDSITDLLMFSKRKFIQELSSQSFSDACEIMKNTFSQSLRSLRVEIFTGNNDSAFENFIEGNDIDVICYIDEFIYNNPSKYSRNPMTVIQKANIPVFKMQLDMPKVPISKNQLAVLFSETI